MRVRLSTRKATDRSLTTLLFIQLITQFVILPMNATYGVAPVLLDLSHLAFAVICIAVLTSHRALQMALLTGLLLLAGGHWMGERVARALGIDADGFHQIIPLTAFGFNALVTAIVMRHVFGPGRVTAHRLQGAILIYLNVAALFAIGYGLLYAEVPGSIVSTVDRSAMGDPGARSAALSYFSLSTLTTNGYGDFLPIHPFARAMANAESVFGQLFPATILARLVGMQLFHAQNGNQS